MPKLQAKTLSSLMEANLPEIPTWVGPSYLPKGGTLLKGGGPKVGKSFSLLEEIRDLLLQNPIYGHPDLIPSDKIPRILLFEQELGEYGLEQRVDKLMRNIPTELVQNVLYVSKVPGFYLDSMEGYTLLRDLVAENRPDIIFLDPIGRMIKGDDNSNENVRELYTNIDKILGEFPDTSAVIAHHFRKPSNEESSRRNSDTLDMHNFRGASQWTGNPDTLVSISRRRDASEYSWYLEMRIVTRQGMPPEDFFLEVNAYNTARVLLIRNTETTPLFGAIQTKLNA